MGLHLGLRAAKKPTILLFYPSFFHSKAVEPRLDLRGSIAILFPFYCYGVAFRPAASTALKPSFAFLPKLFLFYIYEAAFNPVGAAFKPSILPFQPRDSSFTYGSAVRPAERVLSSVFLLFNHVSTTFLHWKLLFYC